MLTSQINETMRVVIANKCAALAYAFIIFACITFIYGYGIDISFRYLKFSVVAIISCLLRLNFARKVVKTP